MGCLFCWRRWLDACQGSEERFAAATRAQPPWGVGAHAHTCRHTHIHTVLKTVTTILYKHAGFFILLPSLSHCHPLSHMDSGEVRKVWELTGVFILSLDVVKSWRPKWTGRYRCGETHKNQSLRNSSMILAAQGRLGAVTTPFHLIVRSKSAESLIQAFNFNVAVPSAWWDACIISRQLRLPPVQTEQLQSAREWLMIFAVQIFFPPTDGSWVGICKNKRMFQWSPSGRAILLII